MFRGGVLVGDKSRWEFIMVGLLWGRYVMVELSCRRERWDWLSVMKSDRSILPPVGDWSLSWIFIIDLLKKKKKVYVVFDVISFAMWQWHLNLDLTYDFDYLQIKSLSKINGWIINSSELNLLFTFKATINNELRLNLWYWCLRPLWGR